jgi:hypothetical protein
VAEATELHDHGLLAFLNDEKATAQPDQRHQTGDHSQAKPGIGRIRRHAAPRAVVVAAAAFLVEDAAEFAVEVSPKLIQIGPSSRLACMASPRATSGSRRYSGCETFQTARLAADVMKSTVIQAARAAWDRLNDGIEVRPLPVWADSAVFWVMFLRR